MSVSMLKRSIRPRITSLTPGLRHAQKLSGLGLLQSACGDHLLQVHHQLRADLEVLGLVA
jgi:hypothetical protein